MSVELTANLRSVTTFARHQLLWASNEASRAGIAAADYFPHDPPLIVCASFTVIAILADTATSIPVPLSVHQRRAPTSEARLSPRGDY